MSHWQKLCHFRVVRKNMHFQYHPIKRLQILDIPRNLYDSKKELKTEPESIDVAALREWQLVTVGSHRSD